MPKLKNPTIKQLKKKIVKMKIDRKTPIKIEILNKNYLGKPVKVLKIYLQSSKSIKKFAEKLSDAKETDINIITKYIIEKNFSPLTWLEIEGDRKSVV